VHLLVHVDLVSAIHGLSKPIKPIKECSSSVLRSHGAWLHLRRPSSWTNTNFAAVGVAPISVIGTTSRSGEAVDLC
jgi:hypothetical protein